LFASLGSLQRFITNSPTGIHNAHELRLSTSRYDMNDSDKIVTWSRSWINNLFRLQEQALLAPSESAFWPQEISLPGKLVGPPDKPRMIKLYRVG
jgi:hypothetical protein